MTKPSQATRVLATLGRAGGRGVTQGDWLVPGGADGAGRITRVAARIEELRSDGLAILAEGKREGFVIYRLVIEASALPARERIDTDGGQLFDLPAQKPSSSHWEAA